MYRQRESRQLVTVLDRPCFASKFRARSSLKVHWTQKSAASEAILSHYLILYITTTTDASVGNIPTAEGTRGGTLHSKTIQYRRYTIYVRRQAQTHGVNWHRPLCLIVVNFIGDTQVQPNRKVLALDEYTWHPKHVPKGGVTRRDCTIATSPFRPWSLDRLEHRCQVTEEVKVSNVIGAPGARKVWNKRENAFLNVRKGQPGSRCRLSRILSIWGLHWGADWRIGKVWCS